MALLGFRLRLAQHKKQDEENRLSLGVTASFPRSRLGTFNNSCEVLSVSVADTETGWSFEEAGLVHSWAFSWGSLKSLVIYAPQLLI